MLERLERLVKEDIEKIKKIKVAVVGLGGVGGHVVESLVRCGIDTIILVDYDTVDKSNLNRQIISTKENIGCKKVDEFEKRINLISDTKVIKLDMFVDENNIDEIFKYDVDFVVDACDTVSAKIAIIENCLKKNVKFISSMGTGNRMDPSKLEIIEIKKTSYDPLAKKVRKILKEKNIKDKVMVICSSEQPIKSSLVGSNSFVPAVSGLLCTSYVINEVLK